MSKAGLKPCHLAGGPIRKWCLIMARPNRSHWTDVRTWLKRAEKWDCSYLTGWILQVSVKWLSEKISFISLCGGRLNEWIIDLIGFVLWWNNSSLIVDKHSLWSQPPGLLFSCYQRAQDCRAHHHRVYLLRPVCTEASGGKESLLGWNKDVKANQMASWFPSALCGCIWVCRHFSACTLSLSISLFVCE